MGVELCHTNDIIDVIGIRGWVGCVTEGGSVMESDQFETLAQYFTFQLKHKLYIFLPIFQSNRIHEKA